MAYNDIFGKDVESYWKDEGCNSRMQKYYKFANLLDKTNLRLKCFMVLIFIAIAVITIFKLSTGCYITDLMSDTKMETVLFTGVDLANIILIGNLILLLGERYGSIKSADTNNFLMKLMLGLPMYYLIGINMKYMNGLTGITMLIVIYLIIINANFLISQRIKKVYDIANGNVGTEEQERELEKVDVVFLKNEVKDNKKGRGEKKYARKR